MAGPPGRPSDFWHAQMDRATPGPMAYGLQLLSRCGTSGLYGGDLAESALVFGFLKSVDEVGVDFFQAGLLSWVDAK